MKIEDFAVEIWMNAHETACAHNIAETCVDSISLGELMALAGKNDTILGELNGLKLTYGAIEGSQRLKTAISGLYQGRGPDEVLVTHGAIGANALLYETLIEPGDEIVSVVPTYQQHYSIPESFQAEVKRLRLKAEDLYLPDLDALEALVSPATRLIAMTNPNNPTGSVMDEAMLRRIVEIARAADAWLICDEVYRGVEVEGRATPPAITDLYEKGISVGSMSKAFALAGLRLGWIAAQRPLLDKVMIHRDYNTISVGMVDDHIAAIALESREALLERNRAIVAANLAMLDEWVAGEPAISWVRPTGGTVTLLQYQADMSSEDFCRRLLAETGVLLVPGSAFEMEGTVRLGFGNGTETLRAGLAGLSRFLKGLSA